MKKHRSAIRLAVALLGLIAILLAIGQLALTRIDEINANREDVLSIHQKKVELARQAMDISNVNNRVMMETLLLRDREQIGASNAARSQNSADITVLFKQIQELCTSIEERELLDVVRDTRSVYVASYHQALHLHDMDHDSHASGLLLVKETLPAMEKYHDALSRFMSYESSQMDAATEQARVLYSGTRRHLAMLIGLAVFLAIAIAIFAIHDNALEMKHRRAAESAVLKLNAELEEKVAQRTELLELAQGRARVTLEELQVRTQGVEAINAIVELLESCNSADEAFSHVAQCMSRYFPSGALLTVNSSRNLLVQAAAWGAAAQRGGPLHLDDCWALRRGRVHVVGPDSFGQLCGHVDPSGVDLSRGANHLCVPLTAHGESLGIIHLQVPERTGEAQLGSIDLRKQEFAVSLGEQISLVLANLRLRETLKYQSVRDPLTGLFNRRHIEESLQRELSRAGRNGAQVPVLMMDIDHFKRFNDSYGHAAGDILLREFGLLMKAQIRGGDIACRWGGEEFLIILPDATLEDAARRAESLRGLVRNLRIQNGSEVLRQVTISIGVAAFPAHGSSGPEILAAADKALYAAKAEGRDRVAVAQDLHDPQVIGIDEARLHA